ncbi:RnfH family protein [Iodobacter sp.]|uniref:RnfH family protein n=1 Tax=Iodobacter sp. TaxID=1915058 RepID=UPI0025FE5350|nr:RnfH family protein [Iodobacter sp.]
MNALIKVEVVYAMPTLQKLLAVQVPAGSSAEVAIRASGILDFFPEIDLSVNKIGIFSKACKLDTVLRAQDRVEIYRALLADPKEIRRQRALEGKVTKKGGAAV